MSEKRITDEFFSLDQRILRFVLKKMREEGEPVTIKEVSDELDQPRTTASDHLNSLADQGLLKREKDGRKKLFKAEPGVADSLLEGFYDMESAYITALDEIRKEELEEIEKLRGGENEDSSG